MTTKLSHLFVVAVAGSGAFVGASRFSASGFDIEVIEATRPAPDSNSASDSLPASDSKAAPDSKLATPSAESTPPVSRGRIATEGAGDAFRMASWTPPPPPPPPPAAPPPPPPPPTAPPLPFSFVGLLEQKSSRPTAFLAKGEALVIAGVGDVIDGTYRVESLSPTGVVVTYLPLSQKQTVGPSGGTP
ncbi:MAG: uncharacterized protein H6R02_635 [Burkholderiaceae bacterium]|jgi:hypothetical protein|nr:uncharacterized protein [Burkholderiaceae bacterium]